MKDEHSVLCDCAANAEELQEQKTLQLNTKGLRLWNPIAFV